MNFLSKTADQKKVPILFVLFCFVATLLDSSWFSNPKITSLAFSLPESINPYSQSGTEICSLLLEEERTEPGVWLKNSVYTEHASYPLLECSNHGINAIEVNHRPT